MRDNHRRASPKRGGLPMPSPSVQRTLCAALGIYKYSQEAMLFSVLSTAKFEGQTLLRFGGTSKDPAVVEPGLDPALVCRHSDR
jgi:hypothetical protein